MRRLTPLLVICACALSAQTKKIVVDNEEPGLIQDLQSVSSKAHIVGVNKTTSMRELPDNSVEQAFLPVRFF